MNTLFYDFTSCDSLEERTVVFIMYRIHKIFLHRYVLMNRIIKYLTIKLFNLKFTADYSFLARNIM